MRSTKTATAVVTEMNFPGVRLTINTSSVGKVTGVPSFSRTLRELRAFVVKGQRCGDDTGILCALCASVVKSQRSELDTKR
jgi:hypothetical protein